MGFSLATRNMHSLTIEGLDARHEFLPAVVPGHHLAEVHDVEGILLGAGLHDLADQVGRGPRPVHHSNKLFLFHDLHFGWDFEPYAVNFKVDFGADLAPAVPERGVGYALLAVPGRRGRCQVFEPGCGGPLALVHKCQLQQHTLS